MTGAGMDGTWGVDQMVVGFSQLLVGESVYAKYAYQPGMLVSNGGP